MRTFALTVVLALAVPALAVARPGDLGDGTFSAKNAKGSITVNVRGTALGKVERGSITVTDMTPGGGDELQVIGYETKKTMKNGVTVYTSDNMRFRFAGGVYLVNVTGTGLNLSVVGRGTAAGTGMTDGLFSADGAKPQPAVAGSYAASFGLQ